MLWDDDCIPQPESIPTLVATSPQRFRWPFWLAVISSVFVVQYFVFGIVHNIVDMRPCMAHSPDPLFFLIAFNARWEIVTVDAYLAVAATVLIALFYRAFRGAELPLLRLGLGIVVMSLQRAATLLLIPLCRSTIALGTPSPLPFIPLTDLRFYRLPIRSFAVNDLVFSGHTAFFLLMLYVTGAWPRSARITLAAFTCLMAYGLLATREHGTIDILLAIPCSVFADRVAVYVLASRDRRRCKTDISRLER